MDKIFRLFHRLSYLQYPFLVLALYYCYRPLLVEDGNRMEDINNGLLFLGIALSFTSLIDINRRTRVGDYIYGNPRRSAIWLSYLCILILGLFGLGIYGQFFSEKEGIKAVATGFMVLGIGVLSLLRMTLEIIKTYR